MNEFVEKVFGGSLKISDFLDKVDKEIKYNGFEPKTSALIGLSICRDDNGRELRKNILSRYDLGYFSLESLAGLSPISYTSYVAMDHHVPENGIAVLMVLAHIGIDKNRRIGFVESAGKTEPRHDCGALCAYLDIVKKEKHPDYSTDPEMTAVANLLKPYEDEIKEEYGRGFDDALIKATNYVYDLSIQNTKKFLRNSNRPFDDATMLVGGVLINTAEHDYIQPRYMKMV